MVGAPDPEVVTDDIVGIYLDSAIDVDRCRTETADTEEQVGKKRGILCMTLLTTVNSYEGA